MVGDLHPLSLATDIRVVYHLKSHLEGQGDFFRQIHGIKENAKIMLASIFASAWNKKTKKMSRGNARKHIQYLRLPQITKYV